MPDYANVFVKVAAIFGVINRVRATAPAHKVFCFSAVAHILTSSVNLAFGPNSGFKNKCLTRPGFGLGPGLVFKMRPFYNSVWACMQGATSGYWKDTSSTHQQETWISGEVSAYELEGWVFDPRSLKELP